MAKILIIEDQELLCRLYGQILSKAKHDVVLAYTGDDGVREALRDRPDLVILDLNLPGLSGAEVAQKLEESGSLQGTALIIATALSSNEAEAIAQSFSTNAVLIKPFHVDSMLAAVKKALTSSGQTVSRS